MNFRFHFNIIRTLAKHRLSIAVAFSAVVGWFLYTSEISAALFTLFIGTFFLSGGSSALNQYQERFLDKKMGRTKNRPLPAGLVSNNYVLITSAGLIVSGTLILVLFNNIVVAGLGLLNVLLYNVVYTKLKVHTQFAVIPGAVVGAIPPLMGWTAAGGAINSIQIIYFAVFMFMWQMSHFWLLLIKFGKEYKQAGFSMLSEKIDDHQIRRLVYFWGILTSLYLLSFPVFFRDASIVITLMLLVLNIGFIIGFYKILFKNVSSQKSTFKAFIFVNGYAFLVMILFIIDAFL